MFIKRVFFTRVKRTFYVCNSTNATYDHPFCPFLFSPPILPLNNIYYLGSSVSSTEKDIDTRLTKAWTAIDRLSIIWKSDLTDKMKRSFFQAAVVSILLYGCTTWTLTKRLEEAGRKFAESSIKRPADPTIRTLAPHHKNYTSSKPDTQDTAGKHISDVLPPLMVVQEWDDQHELTYSSYVKTRVVILKTCRRRWMIGRNGERRSGISAQAARHDEWWHLHVILKKMK